VRESKPTTLIERPWRSFTLRWRSRAVIGVALVLVAAFVELREELLGAEEASPRLLGADAAVLRFFASLRRPWLNGVAVDLTALGAPIIVTLFAVVIGILLLVKHDWQGATTLVVSSLTSALLTVALKTLLERSRPEIVPRVVEVTGLAYPNGHSLASAAVYLTAAFVVTRHIARSAKRLGAMIGAALVVLLIGSSRIYLGVHSPSDVFGGILLGTALALLMAAILHRLDQSHWKHA